MTTSTKTKKIQQTWDIKKMQEEAVKMVSHKIASRIHFLKKHSDKEVQEMEKLAAHLNAEMLASYGVKTPMDLVKYLAEYEVNMFGSKASISGDDQCAVLLNEKSAVWQEAVEANKLSDEQIEIMQDHYKSWMKHLGHGLGFKAHIEFAPDCDTSTVTFTSK